MFDELPRRTFKAILADPPWQWIPRSAGPHNLTKNVKYDTLSVSQLAAMPVSDLAANDCVLFMWGTWSMIQDAFTLIDAWGFTYKTAAFVWTKARADQLEMFRDDIDGQVGLGYWTRTNSEPCLLATRGNPKRINADVRQVIIEPRREHSRKPDCVHKRIERLVVGPYLELFARQKRPGWTCWGNEIDKFREYRDV